MEFSQGSSFTFGFEKRARKAPLLIGEVEVAFTSKETSSQLSSKARKQKKILLWKLLEFAKAFLETEELTVMQGRVSDF